MKAYLLTYGVDIGQDHQHIYQVLVYAVNGEEAIKKVKKEFPGAKWVENNTIE